MSLSFQRPARAPVTQSLVWSNPVARWWGALTLVSAVNIAAWVVLYRTLSEPKSAVPGIGVMLLLSGAYVFGCAFRSLLPRADVQRICLFDTWLSNVMIGRSVATVAEMSFAAQWALLLHQLGTLTGASSTLIAAWVVVPLIAVAQCFSWHAVLTRNYLAHAIENSLWGVAFFIVGAGLCRMVPEFDGAVRMVLVVTIFGITGFLAFLASVDVPMYLTRWREAVAAGRKLLSHRDGLRDVRLRWVVTHDIAEWKEEIPWMSLYFSVAVWSSLALCVFYAYTAHLAR